MRSRSTPPRRRPRRQPFHRTLIEHRPRRDTDQERKCRAPEPDPERVVDILRYVAREESQELWKEGLEY